MPKAHAVKQQTTQSENTLLYPNKSPLKDSSVVIPFMELHLSPIQ